MSDMSDTASFSSDSSPRLEVGYNSSTPLLSKAYRQQFDILRELPKEMRQKIFELCLVNNSASDQHHIITNPKNPALIIALRGEKDLYEEALYILYKINTFYLRSHVCGRLEADIAKRDDNAFRNIRNLGIELVRIDAFIKAARDIKGLLKNLETMHINIKSRANAAELRIVPGLRQLKSRITTLKQFNLNVEMPYIIENINMSSVGKWKRENVPFLVELNHIFGVKSTDVLLRTPVPRKLRWPWKFVPVIHYTWKAIIWRGAEAKEGF